MTTVEDTAAAVEQAENDRAKAYEDAEQATALVTELEDRLRGGDTSVTPKQLTDAEQKARHANLFKDSHDGAVRKAREAADQARLDAAGQCLTKTKNDFSAALAASAPTAVDALADLLTATKDAQAGCVEGARQLAGIPREHTTRPAGVAFRDGHDALTPNNVYVPDMQTPSADDVLGEVIATAVVRVFGDQGYSALRMLNSYQESAIYGAAKRWAGNSRQPRQFVTEDGQAKAADAGQ